MRIPAIILLSIQVLVSACESSDIVELPARNPKLVVASVASANESFRVLLSHSVPSVGYGQPVYTGIPDAQVSVYENGVFLDQLILTNPTQDGISQFASLSKSPVPGNTYRLEIDAQSYESISASYVQPQVVNLDDVQIEAIGSPQQDARLSITFTDPPGENYYEITIQRAYTPSPGPTAQAEYLYLTSIDVPYREGVLGSSIIFPDTRFASKQTVIELTTYAGGRTPSDKPFYTVSLRNIDKTYYLYLKTLYLQGRANLDPYAQSVRIEGNIVNGLGVFTGYTQSQFTVRI